MCNILLHAITNIGWHLMSKNSPLRLIVLHKRCINDNIKIVIN